MLSLYTVIDRFRRHARGRVHPGKMQLTAVHVPNTDLPAFFETRSPSGKTIPSDEGRMPYRVFEAGIKHGTQSTKKATDQAA